MTLRHWYQDSIMQELFMMMVTQLFEYAKKITTELYNLIKHIA